MNRMVCSITGAPCRCESQLSCRFTDPLVQAEKHLRKAQQLIRAKLDQESDRAVIDEVKWPQPELRTATTAINLLIETLEAVRKGMR